MRQWLCWALVSAVAASGLLGLEAWPLTGWRLFSTPRGPVTAHFEARVVSADGVEAPVPFNRLPHGFSGSEPDLERMARQRPDRREPACRAWADATARLGGTTVSEVRVYEVHDDLRDGSTQAALAWTCAQRAR
jgi:hypothetical protein